MCDFAFVITFDSDAVGNGVGVTFDAACAAIVGIGVEVGTRHRASILIGAWCLIGFACTLAFAERAKHPSTATMIDCAAIVIIAHSACVIIIDEKTRIALCDDAFSVVTFCGFTTVVRCEAVDGAWTASFGGVGLAVALIDVISSVARSRNATTVVAQNGSAVGM